jgi:small subunit ribosomal protein S18
MNQNFSTNHSNSQNSNAVNSMNPSAVAGNGVGNSLARNGQSSRMKDSGNLSRESKGMGNRSKTATFASSKGGSSRRETSARNTSTNKKGVAKPSSTLRRRKVLSVSQLLLRVQKQRQLNQKKRQKPIKPIIPPKSLIIILKDKPEKAVYNRRIIDYKHCGLLQRYIGLGGKILPRRQTKLTAKQQRYIAKTIKTARIMGLLPFVTKERGFFR